MQNSKILENLLIDNCDEQNYLFTVSFVASAFPDLSEANLNQLFCRAEKSGILERVCKGVYLYKRVKYDPSTILFKTATLMRPTDFMYVSLESVLSMHSLISQQMLSYVTIITTGRSGIVDCLRFGKIEFVHTNKKKFNSNQIKYDYKTGLFWADSDLAKKDMIGHRRKLVCLVEESNDSL